MSPAGLEPTTYGLKVPEGRVQSSGFDGAHETFKRIDNNRDVRRSESPPVKIDPDTDSSRVNVSRHTCGAAADAAADFELIGVVGPNHYASIDSGPLIDRVGPHVARGNIAPAFTELLRLLPELGNEERVTVIDNALALARAFAGRRGPT